ncbi:MAG TPA: hypothetical protein VIV60_02170, partial [Polyangiaceae bacterium]
MKFYSTIMAAIIAATSLPVGCSETASEEVSTSIDGNLRLDASRRRHTGGRASVGGASSTGGTSARGGTAATGGKNSGGTHSMGGTGGAGGTAPTGGNASGGASANGGRSATGGSGNTAAGNAAATDWLHTDGNKILHADGSRFHGRGADIFDTRQCGSCAWAAPHVDEVIRRIDELVDVWHANFMRFALTSYASNVYNGINLAQWGDVTQDASYLAGLQKIMTHIGTKPGVYVLITLFDHPSLDASELPTSATLPV